MSWMLENEGIKHTLEKYYNLGATIDWFYRLMNVFMMYIERSKIVGAMLEYDEINPGLMEVDSYQRKQERAKKRVYEAMEGQYNAKLKEDIELINKRVGIQKIESEECDKFQDQLVEYLSDRFMKALASMNFEFHANMIKDLSAPSKMLIKFLNAKKAQKGGLRYGHLRRDIISKRGQELYSRGSSENYTFKLLKDCLVKLEIMRMVYINRKPIGLESNIVLLIAENLVEKMIKHDEKKGESHMVQEDHNLITLEDCGAMEIENPPAGNTEEESELVIEA